MFKINIIRGVYEPVCEIRVWKLSHHIEFDQILKGENNMRHMYKGCRTVKHQEVCYKITLWMSKRGGASKICLQDAEKYLRTTWTDGYRMIKTGRRLKGGQTYKGM